MIIHRTLSGYNGQSQVSILLENDSEVQAIRELSIMAERKRLRTKTSARCVDTLADWFRKEVVCLK